MPKKDEGKNLGYHWRRSLGIYDDPDRPKDQPPGNAHTTTDDLHGLGGAAPTPEKDTTES